MSTAHGGVEVQVFGTKKHADTRAALRFFSERRVRTHFVDLLERPASPGELQRFAQRFGAAALVDRTSKRFIKLGLGPARYGDAKWISLLADEPLLIKQPLTRCKQQVAVGMAPDTWTAWIAGS